MKEKKFRAWDKLAKVMSQTMTLRELTQYEHHFESLFGGHLALFDDLIWLEYTGLKDKNGVEIYEGDRLQWLWYGVNKVDGELLKTEVTWDNHLLQWYAKPNPLHSLCGKDELEVIGNIHELT